MTFARRRGLLATALLPLSSVGGCASSPIVEDAGGLRHTRHGYWIAAPEAASPAWRRVEVEGSALAYRRAGPVWITLSSRCGIPLTRPEILARHLRIGIPEHVVREDGQVESQGLSGWQQVFDARQDGAVVRIRTVTMVIGRCALDAVLSARDEVAYQEALPAFEAWWRSLRPESGPQGRIADGREAAS